MKIKFLLPFAFMVTLAFSLTAQPGPGMRRGELTRINGPVEPPLIPIDAGASILLAAGAFFGAKKLFDASKKKQ